MGRGASGFTASREAAISASPSHARSSRSACTAWPPRIDSDGATNTTRSRLDIDGVACDTDIAVGASASPSPTVKVAARLASLNAVTLETLTDPNALEGVNECSPSTCVGSRDSSLIRCALEFLAFCGQSRMCRSSSVEITKLLSCNGLLPGLFRMLSTREWWKYTGKRILPKMATSLPLGRSASASPLVSLTA